MVGHYNTCIARSVTERVNVREHLGRFKTKYLIAALT